MFMKFDNLTMLLPTGLGNIVRVQIIGSPRVEFYDIHLEIRKAQCNVPTRTKINRKAILFEVETMKCKAEAVSYNEFYVDVIIITTK